MNIFDNIVCHAAANKLNESMVNRGKKKQEETRNPSLLKTLVSNPDIFKLEAWVDNGALQITIRKREE